MTQKPPVLLRISRTLRTATGFRGGMPSSEMKLNRYFLLDFLLGGLGIISLSHPFFASRE